MGESEIGRSNKGYRRWRNAFSKKFQLHWGRYPLGIVDDITFKIEKTEENLSKLGLSKATAKIWPKGSVIVSTGSTIGHGQSSYGNKNPKKSITNEYLAYFLLAHTHLLVKYPQGSSFKEIRSETTKKMAFSYPGINRQEKHCLHSKYRSKRDSRFKVVAEKYHIQKRGLMEKLLTGEWRVKE